MAENNGRIALEIKPRTPAPNVCVLEGKIERIELNLFVSLATPELGFSSERCSFCGECDSQHDPIQFGTHRSCAGIQARRTDARRELERFTAMQARDAVVRVLTDGPQILASAESKKEIWPEQVSTPSYED